MKTKCSLVILLPILLTIQILAQSTKEIKNSEVEGIYLTLDDFKQNNLTRPIDKQHNRDKISLKQFFISPEIISVEQENETIFYKDSIFAIRLTNGENYRFIERLPCLIADTSYLYIYTFITSKTEHIHSGPYRRSKEIPITSYYFSYGGHKTILSLTLVNICKYLPAGTIVQTTICNKFSTYEMLTKINTQTGRFELNETILSVLDK